MCDPICPSWVEDPSPALGNIKTYLERGAAPDFAAARSAAIEEREAAIDTARSKLTRSEQETFDAALANCQKANFLWWNEDHNFHIDSRTAIPLRKAYYRHWIERRKGAAEIPRPAA